MANSASDTRRGTLTRRPLLLVAVGCCLQRSCAADPRIRELDPVDLIAHLRASDRRLVRPSPDEVTLRRREDGYTADRLQQSVRTLCDASARSSRRQNAAEIAVLCTTDHPSNRQLIGSDACVAGALVELVKATTGAEEHTLRHRRAASARLNNAAAAAAEAIWILSFNHAANHAAFVAAGAVEALSELIVSSPLSKPDAPSSAAARLAIKDSSAVMWAAAALQNLAASYCETADGRCRWRWQMGAAGDGEALVPDGAFVVDAEPARARALRVDGLLAALSAHVCSWTGDVAKRGKRLPWPATATVAIADNAPSIIPWAAAGALKNLALSRETLAQLPSSTVACLCALSASPDWLESSKSQAALLHLGRTDDCKRADEAQKGEL